MKVHWNKIQQCIWTVDFLALFSKQVFGDIRSDTLLYLKRSSVIIRCF